MSFRMRSLVASVTRGALPNRAQRQVWGGKQQIFGVKSSDDKKSPKKSPKIWKPNVFSKKFFSDLLEETFKIRITAREMRSVDKAGSFDNYILKYKHNDSKVVTNLQNRMRSKLPKKSSSSPSTSSSS
eukprot:m.36018 g.36018  ORF g.36018 m.36018 type:complete len:128 (+) comp10067_c0_seq2:75-458(+)